RRPCAQAPDAPVTQSNLRRLDAGMSSAIPNLAVFSPRSNAALQDVPKPLALKSNEPLGAGMVGQAQVTRPSTSLAAAPVATKGAAPSEAIIRVKDLVKVFDPDIRAVDGISFEVRRGEIFGFLGPNGAGKSTTIKIIVTLLQKTAGAVAVDGFNLEKEPAKIREIIGYAAQEISVDDDLTGRENLRLQCRFYHIPRDET